VDVGEKGWAARKSNIEVEDGLRGIDGEGFGRVDGGSGTGKRDVGGRKSKGGGGVKVGGTGSGKAKPLGECGVEESTKVEGITKGEAARGRRDGWGARRGNSGRV
jgi:hypothetical protein